MGGNTYAFVQRLLGNTDLDLLSSASATWFDHFGFDGVVLSARVRIPIFISTLLGSSILILAIKFRHFPSTSLLKDDIGASWGSFFLILLTQARFYVYVSGASLCSIVTALPVIFSTRVGERPASVAFGFVGAFLGTLLVSARWRKTYWRQGLTSDEGILHIFGISIVTAKRWVLLILSGLVIGIVDLIRVTLSGNIFSALSISGAPLVYLITFSSISMLATCSLAVLLLEFGVPTGKISGKLFVLAGSFSCFLGLTSYTLMLTFDIAASIQVKADFQVS